MSSSGDKLIKEANKKAENRSWFGGSANKEVACELYGQAGDAYKLDMQWEKAAKAYILQAEIYIDMKEDTDANHAYLNAAKCYKKIDSEEAIKNYLKSIEICKKTGRLHLAASSMKQVAELYEDDLGLKEDAVKAFLNSASWYLAEDSIAQANACILRAAHIEADTGKYKEAVEHFEEVIENSKQNRLSRFSLRDYFFKASLCRMCLGDFDETEGAVERYKRIDETYNGSREAVFIDKILKIATESRDIDEFLNVVSEWDKITKLDTWKTNLLLNIKRSISEVDFT